MRHGHVWSILILCSLVVLVIATRHSGYEPYTKQRVTRETYPRAEMNAFMRSIVNRATRTNLIVHERTHEESMKTRLGRLDTLHSYAVLDTETNPVVTFRHTPGAYSSMIVYDQDNYVVGMARDSGTYQFKRKESPTRYLLIVYRFFVKDTDDFRRVYAYQDQCTIKPSGTASRLDIEEFDPESVQTFRKSLQPSVKILEGRTGKHGFKGSIGSDDHLLASYMEQGGLPESEMVYRAVRVPAEYPKKLRFVPPPPTEETGFWSVTVYDQTYTVPRKTNIYVNSKTVRYHPMGSVELTFTNDTSDTDRNTVHVDKESLVIFRTYRPSTIWEVPQWARV